MRQFSFFGERLIIIVKAWKENIILVFTGSRRLYVDQHVFCTVAVSINYKSSIMLGNANV